MQEHPLRPGDKIAGKYRIQRRLGQGGMGMVFLAEHERLGRQVAIKVLHAQLEQREVAMARFEREIRAMAQVSSRHVAQAFDADVLEDGSPFLVMEYLDGRDLRAELKLRRAIPYPEAAGYIVQTCEGVAAVHDVGIIHRDLKPNNLFITHLDAARCVKVLDFGIVKLLSTADVTMTAENTSVGTPLYMSPEQLNNEREISPCSDVWAMTVVLYELIAGVSPFAADRPGAVVAAIMLEQPPLLSRLVSALPSQLADVIAEGLEKSPSRRIGSARELASRLAPFAMPTDRIVVASNMSSGRPVAISRKDSLRPELAAQIQHEVERGAALAGSNEQLRVDELRQLPSLARLAIPLTHAAAVEAARGTPPCPAGNDRLAQAPSNLPSDAPTRLEFAPKGDPGTAAVRTTASARKADSRSSFLGAGAVGMLLLGAAILGLSLKSATTNRRSQAAVSAAPHVASGAAQPPASESMVPPVSSAPPLAGPDDPVQTAAPRTKTSGQQTVDASARAKAPLAPRSKAVGAPPNTPHRKPPEVALPHPKDGNPAHL
ncbi:MAG TPA: protein kinase [Polyangiaceae bacterium]|nr:protein kinase [Polyangiaceae bacterium]